MFSEVSRSNFLRSDDTFDFRGGLFNLKIKGPLFQISVVLFKDIGFLGIGGIFRDL